MAGSSMMLRSFHKRPGYLQALDRVKEWTRVRFKLPQDAAILVTEVACALPGCPPLETVVAFWTERGSTVNAADAGALSQFEISSRRLR